MQQGMKREALYNFKNNVSFPLEQICNCLFICIVVFLWFSIFFKVNSLPLSPNWTIILEMVKTLKVPFCCVHLCLYLIDCDIQVYRFYLFCQNRLLRCSILSCYLGDWCIVCRFSVVLVCAMGIKLIKFLLL